MVLPQELLCRHVSVYVQKHFCTYTDTSFIKPAYFFIGRFYKGDEFILTSQPAFV